MVRNKLVVQDVIPCTHVERRLGQSSCRGNRNTCGLRSHKSCVCGDPAVCVRSLLFIQYRLLTSVP
jgi:hypothetical protein